MSETIDGAREAAIRRDERQRIAAEVRQMREDKLSALEGKELSYRRARYEGHVTAYSAVLARLGERA